MKIIARQQFGLTLLEPLLGLAGMAFGARPVPAAVVTPKRVVAVVAVVEGESEDRQCTGQRGQAAHRGQREIARRTARTGSESEGSDSE